MKLIISLVFITLLSLAYSQGYSRVKIFGTDNQIQELSNQGVTIDHGVSKKNTFFISDFSAAEVDIIQASGLQYEIIYKDVQKYYREINSKGSNEKNTTCPSTTTTDLPEVPSNFYMNSSYAGFYKYQDMLDALDDMASQYPNLITSRQVAPNTTYNTDSTHQGNYVFYVKISNNASVTDDLAKPNVLYTAIHHAREPLSMSQLLFYMWYLLENYDTNDEIKFLVDNTEMFFIPCLNPDGYLINEADNPSGFGMHRKNGRDVGTSNPGVDLNRNYSYGWNTTGVSPNVNNDTYPGTSAFSEPETQSMKFLAETYDFKSAYNAHTYGNMLLYPIGTTTAEYADHNDYFAELSAHMVQYNGYNAQKSSGLYPASGDSDDYLYKVDIGVGNKDTVFSWTPEIGTDFWPSQGEIIPTCQGMVFPNMVMAHMAHKYLAVSDEDPSMLGALNGNFTHSVTRFGLEDGAVTVSIEPLLNIQSVGVPVIYDLIIRESASNTISYQLNPSIQYGDEVKYVLNTDYGTWIYRDTITKTYGTMTLQVSDDASNANNWTGSWMTTNADYVSPSSSFTDSDGSNYSNGAYDVYTYNQSVDLTNATSAMVSFYAKWSIEADYDYCQFQVSTNGGSTWQGQCGQYTVDGTSANGSVQPNNLPVWEGSSDWVLEEINLSDYLGQSIQVRFILESDGGVTDDGFYFDDFQIAYNESNAGLLELTSEMMVFPNPATNRITISTEDIMKDELFEVYNVAGKLIWSGEVTQPTKQFSIETEGWDNGVYYLRLNGVSTTKFTVIK